MKSVILSSLLAFSMASFAAEGPKTDSTPTASTVQSSKKMAHNEAKEICKKEGKKGKELQKCIHEQMSK